MNLFLGPLDFAFLDKVIADVSQSPLKNSPATIVFWAGDSMGETATAMPFIIQSSRETEQNLNRRA